MRLLWLPEVLRAVGLEVIELDGWRSRGRDLDVVYGVVVHDTVTTSAWSDASVDNLIANGKPDTPGPLYQLGVDRQARYRLVASGRANHAGYSRPWGNSSLGIGVYCAGGLAGREEPWSDDQREAVTVGARAILDHLDLGRSDHFNPRVAGHKEIDTRGKVDPYGIDMNGLRRDVGRPIEIGRTVTSGRIAGDDRWGTAAAMARTIFPHNRHQGGIVWLVRGDKWTADTIPAGQIPGPCLPVPPDGDLPRPIADEIRAYRPDRVMAIGGTGAVSDGILEQARQAAAR